MLFMELVCGKLNKKLDEGDANCPHGNNYCKFRTSCVIHYIEKQEKLKKCNSEKIHNKSDSFDNDKISQEESGKK